MAKHLTGVDVPHTTEVVQNNNIIANVSVCVCVSLGVRIREWIYLHANKITNHLNMKGKFHGIHSIVPYTSIMG